VGTGASPVQAERKLGSRQWPRQLWVR